MLQKDIFKNFIKNIKLIFHYYNVSLILNKIIMILYDFLFQL